MTTPVIPLVVDVELDESPVIEVTVETDTTISAELDDTIRPVVIPGYESMLRRIAAIEAQEPGWDAKYDENNQPPYPVTSVDFRVGAVRLNDLYDTDGIPLADIADLFTE